MSPTHNFYVYGHYKPDGNIFYIGKGHGNRACQTSSRNNFWRNTVNKHGTYHIVLLHEHLSEDEAFNKEKEEIEFWGRRKDGGFLINLTDGGDGISGYVYTAEQSAKLTAIMLKRYQDPAARAKTKAAMLKRFQDPAARAKMKSAAQKQTREFSVISPDGTPYPNQRNANEFCRVHGLDRAAMSNVLKGTYTHHKGWRMYTDGMPCVPCDFKLHKTTIKEFSVISPDGTLYPNQRNLREFCRVHGLNESHMCKVLKGIRNYHKGWKTYTPPSNNHLINQFL